MKKRVMVLMPFAILFLPPARTSGHPLQVSTITVSLEDRTTKVTAVVHAARLAGRDPAAAIPSALRVRLDSVPFHASTSALSFDESAGTIIWEGKEARTASAVTIDAPLFPDEPSDYTVVVVYRDGQIADRAVLDRDTAGAILAETTLAFTRRFVGMGVHHILSGMDHVLFIVGLLLVRGTFRGILAVVTAFTIAHSITLSMTVLHIGSLPSRLVEAVIALSIVAVGAENLVHRKVDVERRAWLAFGFGFFHGFGFAGALGEAGLPRESIAWSLASFNVGVEIGQACVVAAAVPLLRFSERMSPMVASAATRFASAGIAAAGVVWLVERLRT
jgi:hydrogenase/urease accessory protein HupE